MALIRSEISKYKDIVLALDREMHNRGQKEIAWDSFTHEEDLHSPHSVVIGKVSEELKNMGFMRSFTYDKLHLQNAMYPEDSFAPHSHGLTVNELLQLPDSLNHPIAILTEHEGKARKIDGDDYRCLHFIFAAKEDDEQKYYRAIVHPQAHHNGIIMHGPASKVITHYRIDDLKFNAIFNSVLNGKRQMLYFDHDKYMQVESGMKPIEFCNYQSFSMPIRGHFTQDAKLKDINLDHREALSKAATAEMNKLILGKITRGDSLQLFGSSVNALAHGNTLDTIKSAHSTIQKLSSLTTDMILRRNVGEYADKSFALSYTRLLTPEIQNNCVSRAKRRIDRIGVGSQADIEYVCDEIERVMKTLPTLKNMNVDFSDRVASVPSIIKAREASAQLQEAVENELAVILNRKNEELKMNRQMSGIDDIGRER